MKYCPNCGKPGVEGVKFCPSCGTKLLEKSVVTSDTESEAKPSVGPMPNEGLQRRPRSAALKWVTGLLFVLTAIYLYSLINLIYLIQVGFEVPFFLGDFIAFPLTLAAAICAAKRTHWGYVRGVTIWLVISSIIGTLLLLGSGEIGIWLPEDIALIFFVFSAEITCLALIYKAKAEFSRGDAYDQMGEHGKTIADYNKAVELAPDSADAYYNRGDVYDEMGEYGKAIADYSKAIELAPNRASAYYNRGCAYGELGAYDKALADYTKAIELNPNDSWAYYNRGLAYSRRGEAPQALYDLEKCIELSTDAKLTEDAIQALREVKKSS